MFFDTIKKETRDLIILTNSTESIIGSLFLILTGLFGVWLFSATFSSIFNNFSIDLHSFFSIIIGVIILSLIVLFILQGFHDLIVKSKATIDLNLLKVVVERKSIVKGLEFVKEINICDLKEIKIVKINDPESSYSWYVNFVTNTGNVNFTLYSDKSKLTRISNKINKLIIHK